MNNVAKAIDNFLVKSELPVLFAGAGVSARAGLPVWSSYLKELAGMAGAFDEYTKYQMDEAIAEGYLEDAASYYQIARKIPEATRLLELVKPLENYQHDKLRDLASLPFSCFITTNFDRAILDAYSLATGKAAREINLGDPAMDGAPFERSFYVARVHGRIEVPKSMMLSKADFGRLLGDGSYVNFLTHIFTRRQVLFLGFSFLDPAIRAVLQAIKTTFQSSHGQEHLALIPSNASNDFIKELETHSIRRETYEADTFHSQLWAAVGDVAGGLKGGREARGNEQDFPFRLARKYLATAYARVKVGGSGGALARAIAEGIVSGMIQQSFSAGVMERDLVSMMLKEISLEEDAAKSLVSQSVVALAKEGIVKINTVEKIPRYVFSGNQSSSYEQAITRLVEGVISRFEIREGRRELLGVRDFLRDFFISLVLRRGWDLGASFASRKVPENVDVLDVIGGLDGSAKYSLSEISKLAGTIEDLLMRPDDEEAVLLSELGRLGFGLELMIEAPHDALFYQKTLPERIYLDANVLMPAIAYGHPHQELLSATLKTLQDSASKAVLKVSICVYEGFLNEIVSHRLLAIQAMEQQGGDGAMWAEREAGLLGTANVNVYVGAYLNRRTVEPGLSFREYLRRYAPYKTEIELRSFLEKKGFEMVKGLASAKESYPEILHSLEKFYASRLEKGRKSSIVVAHDANQISILKADMTRMRRSVLVSADRTLRFALEGSPFYHVSGSIISHIGLAQLVELLVGRIPSSRGMASLLWMSSVSTDTERIRNHLISLALREHDVAMTMGMTQVVDAISEDAGIELAARGLSLHYEGEQERTAVNAVLERYEKDFFAKMNKESSKYGRRSS